jgi:hypothetical protein
MNLDSVRELKQDALERVVQPMMAAAPRALDLAFAATPMSALRGTPRLMALGIAPTRQAGQFKLAVRLQRHSLAERAEVERLRQMSRNEVDVRFIGRVHKRATAPAPWHRERNRPLSIGGSVGHFNVTAGTLGGFVRTRGRSDVLMLSNNHVLADENRASRGDAVLQPGSYDGGRRPRDTVAALERFVPLRLGRANFVDCATARLLTSIEWAPNRMAGLGRLRGVAAAPAVDGLLVAKVGRTTGVTRGRITAFELDDVVVAYDIGNVSFDNQLEIESTSSRPFSDGGDSGSLIVDRAKNAVAQLFAGSDTGGRRNLGLTYATPIQTVLDALRVELIA